MKEKLTHWTTAFALAVVAAGCGKENAPAATDGAKVGELQKQVANLRKELQEAKRETGEPRVEVIETKVVVPGASTDSPEEVIQYLRSVDLKRVDQRNGNTDEHRIQVRQVIRQFEELTAMGGKALPAIKQFFAEGLDKEFRENTNEIVSGNWSRGQVYLDPIFPPSLRMGLLNTVRHIGKREGAYLGEAEKVLLNVLDTTGRFVEVAYIAQALDDLAKDKHKDAYLKAARELLSGPIVDPTNETPVLDRQNRWLLFELLRRNKDLVFVDKAKEQLVREITRKNREGNEEQVMIIDRAVQGYLTGVLGAKVMPIVSDLYNRPETNDSMRSQLRQIAAGYMGVSEEANVIVNSRVTEAFSMIATEGDAKEQQDMRRRGRETARYYLRRLGDGREIPVETLMSRQKFLSSLRAQTQDKELITWMDRTQQRLVDMADPEKAKNLRREFDPRSDPNRGRQR